MPSKQMHVKLLVITFLDAREYIWTMNEVDAAAAVAEAEPVPGAWDWHTSWPGDAPLDASSDEAFDYLISSSSRRVSHDLVVLMIRFLFSKGYNKRLNINIFG